MNSSLSEEEKYCQNQYLHKIILLGCRDEQIYQYFTNVYFENGSNDSSNFVNKIEDYSICICYD